MKMTAAQAMLSIIKKYGVTKIFGYPGTAVAPIYNEIPKSGIVHILTANEQAAAMAAASSYKTIRKIGVCIATSGPGATNLLTGIANAYMDSVPLLCITGQVSIKQIGTDAFQEVDTTGITTPVSKHNYLIKDAKDLPCIVDEAIKTALSGRMGPVIVDIPFDIQTEIIDYKKSEIFHESEEIKEIDRQITDIISLISLSKKPLIVAGGGVIWSRAEKLLCQFAEITKIPVVSTMMGIGALPCDLEIYLGMVGVHGNENANAAIQNADLVILLGSRVSDRTIPNPELLSSRAKIVHVDIDPAEIDKNILSDINIVSDIKTVLKKLIDASEKLSFKKRWDSFESKPHFNDKTNEYINPKLFLKKLSEKTKENVIITTEVGQNQVWTANYFDFKEKSILFTSGGFGTMGYGLPAAIGAKIYAPKRSVIAIEGDGSFIMAMNNLTTIKKYDLDIKIVVFSNRSLGMVRQVQKHMYESNFVAVDIGEYFDVLKLADAFQIESMRINRNDEIENGIKKMLASKKAFILDISVDPYFE